MPCSHSRRAHERTAATQLAARALRQVAMALATAGVLFIPAACAAQGNSGSAVEFDLPNGEITLIKSGADVRFEVGYFAQDAAGDEPLFSYSAEQATVMPDGRVRVSLRVWKAPANRPIVVRIRTVTGSGTSPWSTASPPVSVERLAGRVSRGDARTERLAARNAKATALVAEQMRSNSALLETLAKRFPGVDLEYASAGYPNLQNFIAAMIAASRLKIPFEELKPLTLLRQRNTLELALRKLRPESDATAEARKALEEAAVIVKTTRPRRGRTGANPAEGATDRSEAAWISS